jgi:hypothetical protein
VPAPATATPRQPPLDNESVMVELCSFNTVAGSALPNTASITVAVHGPLGSLKV